MPVCFFISSSVDAVAFKKLFSVIREHTGVIETRFFMSDDYPAYYAAWSSLMGSAANRLLCTWHVLNNWSKNMNKISDLGMRDDVMGRMKEILKITSVDEFEIEYARYCKYLDDNEATKNCALYLRENYTPRRKNWAYCYRPRLGINTNMHLESMHKKLKYSFFEGKGVKRLDVAISCLMQMLLDYQFNRIINQELGESSNKVWINRQRHLQGTDLLDTVAKVSENCWSVHPVSKSDIYTIMEDGQVKCCSNFCELCNICVHAYRCDCPDNTVTMAICKHIHAIHSAKKTNANGESGENLIISDHLVSEERDILLASSQILKKIYELPVHEWMKWLKMSFENTLLLVKSSDEARTVSLGLKRIQAQLRAKKKSSIGTSKSPKKIGRPSNIKRQRSNWMRKRKNLNPLSKRPPELISHDKLSSNLINDQITDVNSSLDRGVDDMRCNRITTTIIEEVCDE